MTPTQKAQFNRMRDTLRMISKEFMTPAQLRNDKGNGLEFEEYIEMAYENIQSAAKTAVKGVKALA